MTTPTKEQIKELCLHLCFNCENDFPCDGHCYKCESEHWKKYKWQVRQTVKLWEKIRNSPKQGKINDSVAEQVECLKEKLASGRETLEYD